MNETIEHLEKAVVRSANSDNETTLKRFVDVARNAAKFFENSSESQRLKVANRLQTLGDSIAGQMPNQEQTEAASRLVQKVMGYANFTMDVSSTPAPVKNANIDIAISSLPTMG